MIVHTLPELLDAAGRDLGPTAWVELTQDRVDRFADATGDHQWIHVDPVRAAAGPFGGTIAHGYLTLALVNLLLPELIEVRGATHGVNYGLDRVRFPAPLRVGARFRGRGTVQAVERVRDGAQVVVRVTVEVEDQERPACVADTISRFSFPPDARRGS